MTGKKTKINRIVLVLSLIATMLLTGMHSVFAVDAANMPDLERDSNLTIMTQYTDEDVTTPIKGMELVIYKVADLDVTGGVANYTSVKAFKAVNVDYNKLTTESSIAAAADLADFLEGSSIKGVKAVSDADGKAEFGSVSNGMYLVIQSGATGDADNYTRLKPYLLMAPQADPSTGGWNYEVVSIPKMEVLNKIIKISKKVNGNNNTAIESRTDKFSYDILAEVGYEPESFAIVDNVPDPLEIVDEHLIEIRLGDRPLTDDELKSMLKVRGNTLRVEMSAEQIKKYAPFEMSVMFYCRFRNDIELTEENVSVVNRAGYEVEGEYFEPPGDEHEATVKGVFKPKESIVKKAVKIVQTGDYNMIALWAGLLAAAIAVVTVLTARRRRRG